MKERVRSGMKLPALLLKGKDLMIYSEVRCWQYLYIRSAISFVFYTKIYILVHRSKDRGMWSVHHSEDYESQAGPRSPTNPVIFMII